MTSAKTVRRGRVRHLHVPDVAIGSSVAFGSGKLLHAATVGAFANAHLHHVVEAAVVRNSEWSAAGCSAGRCRGRRCLSIHTPKVLASGLATSKSMTTVYVEVIEVAFAGLDGQVTPHAPPFWKQAGTANSLSLQQLALSLMQILSKSLTPPLYGKLAMVSGRLLSGKLPRYTPLPHTSNSPLVVFATSKSMTTVYVESATLQAPVCTVRS